MGFGVELLNKKCVFNGIVWISLTLLMVEIMSVSSETTTSSPSIDCSHRNSSCDYCVQNVSCYYCFKTGECNYYPYTTPIPQEKCGGLKDMAWKTCLVKFNVLVIVLGSVGGALLLAIIICCCCCCRKVKRAQMAAQLAKWERQRADRKAHQDERRQEREARRNEIREKYGLGTTNNKYSRFD